LTELFVLNEEDVDLPRLVLYGFIFEFVCLFVFEEKEKLDPFIVDPPDFVDDPLEDVILDPVNKDPLEVEDGLPEIVEVLPPVNEDPLDFEDDPLEIVEVLPPVNEDPLDFEDDPLETTFPFVGELIVGVVTRLSLRFEEMFLFKVVLEYNKKEVLELEQFLH